MQILHNGWLFDTDIRATLRAIGPLSEDDKKRIADKKLKKQWAYYHENRRWKDRCHKVFDLLWKSGTMTRNNAYLWLERVIGKEHISHLNVEECKEVVRILKEQFPVCKD